MKNTLITFLCLTFFLSMNACDQRALKVEGQTLKLAVVSGPFTYQRFADLQTGYEFDIIQRFALDSGLNLKIQLVKNQDALLAAVNAGETDMAAGRIVDVKTGDATPKYDSEKSVLICHKKTKLNRDIPLVLSGSPRYSLRRIQEGKLDCAWVDRLQASSYLRMFKDLKIFKESEGKRSYHFVINAKRPDLQLLFGIWLKNSGRALAHIKSDYQNRESELPSLDVQHFMKLKDSTLPVYVKTLRKHAKDFSIPWQLVAAVAYQESKWNPDAKSFTGVRGFMQLTQETAEHLGVEDRTDGSQSIYGGVKYLRMLLNRQPTHLAFQERLALALATYNVGPAHMLDAQNLALRLGKNPYSWIDLKDVLPLLANPIYFPHLKYGPARGQEPVTYVSRVFAYLDLITTSI